MKKILITLLIFILVNSVTAQTDNYTKKKKAKAFKALTITDNLNESDETLFVDIEQSKAIMPKACGFYMNL